MKVLVLHTAHPRLNPSSTMKNDFRSQRVSSEHQNVVPNGKMKRKKKHKKLKNETHSHRNGYLNLSKLYL